MDAVTNVDGKVKSIITVQSVQDAKDALNRAGDDEHEMFRALFADPRSEILLWGDTGIAILLVEEDTARCVVLKGVEEAVDLPTLLQRWEEVRGVTVNWDQTVRIAPVAVEDLPLCFPLGLAYYKEIPVPGTFVPAIAQRTWTALLTKGSGHLVGLWRGDRLVGMFGGLLAPRFHDGVLMAWQAVWYVQPDQRGTPWSGKLVDAFTAWATAHGATVVRMGYYVTDPHAEKLASWLTRRGAVRQELSWDLTMEAHDA